MYSIGKAAEVIGVCPETIRRWDRSGKINCIRTAGGQRRIPESEIKFILGLTKKDFPDMPKQPSRVKSPIMKLREVLNFIFGKKSV